MNYSKKSSIDRIWKYQCQNYLHLSGGGYSGDDEGGVASRRLCWAQHLGSGGQGSGAGPWVLAPGSVSGHPIPRWATSRLLITLSPVLSTDCHACPTTHCQLETCRTRSMQRRSPCEYSHHRHLVNVISIILATLHSMKIMISLSLEIMCSNFMSCLCSAGQSEYCDCELSTFNH